jgi:hypothetical protein
VLIDSLLADDQLKIASRNYIVNYMTPKQTVDIVLSKTDTD